MESGTYIYTYLGLFDRVAEWVFSGISKALTWLFKSIFGPIFKAVLEPVASQIIDMLKKAFASLLYLIFQGLLRIIDVIQTSFMIFSGATKVRYNDEEMALVEIFFRDSAVSKAFWGITGIAMLLIFVFTIAAVAKKAADVEMSQQRSLSNILTDLVKGMITFVSVPALSLAAVMLSTIVVSGAYDATTVKSAEDGRTSETTIAKTLFTSTISEAVDKAKKKDHGSGKWENYNKLMMVREPWEYVKGDRDNDKSIPETSCIDYYIELQNIDFLVGYFSAIFLIWNLMAVSIQFVQRIFDLVMLYLICPFFAAYMPLDGGEKLKKWQGAFLGKLGGGIGLLIMVNLYLMMVPMVMNNKINLTGGDVAEANSAYNSLIKLIFILGAAMAVKNSGSLMTTLIDAEAGAAESQGMASSMSGMAGAASWGFSKMKERAQGRQQRKQEKAQKAQAKQKTNQGKEFAKAEKSYQTDMKRANELDAAGHNDQATSLRNAASSQWNMELNRASKSGLIQMDSNKKSGYRATDANFKAGLKEGQGKSGIMYNANKWVKKKSEAFHFHEKSAQNKATSNAMGTFYHRNVKDSISEAKENIGNKLSKTAESFRLDKSWNKGKQNAANMDAGKQTFVSNRDMQKVAAAREQNRSPQVRAQDPNSPVEKELSARINKSEEAIKQNPSLADSQQFMQQMHKDESDLKLVQGIRKQLFGKPAGASADGEKKDGQSKDTKPKGQAGPVPQIPNWNKPSDKPAAKPSDKPAAKPSDKPAAKPAAGAADTTKKGKDSE